MRGRPRGITVGRLDPFFYPDSVAVIGASREPGSVGHELLRVMVENQKSGLYRGRLYAVNPKAKEPILGVPTYPSVSDLPEPVDLGVIVVPARVVPAVVDECGRKGIKHVIVISGGFAEVGGEGVELQEKLVEVARRHGIRIVGPNCVGVVCPETGVDTMFLPYKKELGGRGLLSLPRPGPGNISLLTQSGAFGVACVDYMAGEGLGLAKFVSYGNKADIDEVELMEYLADDPKTRVIVIYAESIEEGRRFIEAARRTVPKKPVVVLKAGRTRAGARAASSHTAALAGADEVYSAAFRQAGVVRVYEVEELFDVTKALSMQPPARGPRIAVLTDGGGAGVMTADELESKGAVVVQLSEETQSRLRELMDRGVIPPISAVANPVDVTGSATDDAFVESLRILLDAPEVDGVIVLPLHHVPGLTSDLPERIAAEARGRGDKPVLVVDIGQGEYGIAYRERFDELGIPAYPTPERAARAMVGLIKYGEALKRMGAL